ncbi:MAG: hypothetical protein ACQGVC_09705 [Myxococcota bacterium]
MTATAQRRLACAVVACWIAALAVGRAQEPHPDPPPEPAADPPRARVQAVPQPAPEPVVQAADPPPPEPAPARPAPPEPPAPSAVLSAADLARGDHLLSDTGRFPVISASYQGMQSFRRYAAAMTGLGGRFVVVSRRRIVGEIDLSREPVGIREPALGPGFSPRARDYSDEPALAGPARSVRERFGPDAEIMLLVPRAVDAGLFGGIARELARVADGHAEFREIEGRYEQAPGGSLRFRLVSAVHRDGRRIPLGSVLDLGALAMGGRG